MDIIGRKLTLKEFNEYVSTKNFGTIPPDRVVLHHTWRPTLKSWSGKLTIEALKKFYERKGWTAGPHLFIAPDGIWLFTDMYEVGIHAGEGNATYVGGKLVGYSIGIEVVGTYDKKLWSGIVKQMTLGVISSLQKTLKFKNEKIEFHRDYSTKTCPGSAITKSWVLNELHKYNDQSTPSEGEKEKIKKIIEAVDDIKTQLQSLL